MPEITPAYARALKAGHIPFLLFYCDHPSGAARFWSRTGILRFQGQDYQGLGILGSISGAVRSVNLTINEVTFQLRGVPPTSTKFLSGSVRNRVAQVMRGAISPRGIVTVEDDSIIDSILETQTLSVDPSNGAATIKLTGYQGFYVLDRAQDLAWTDQQQRSEFATDCGFAMVHTFVQRDSNWRAA